MPFPATVATRQVSVGVPRDSQWNLDRATIEISPEFDTAVDLVAGDVIRAIPQRIELTPDQPSRTLELLASDTPGLSVSGFPWRVTYAGPGMSRTYRVFIPRWTGAPGAAPVLDLDVLAPVTTDTGVTVYVPSVTPDQLATALAGLAAAGDARLQGAPLVPGKFYAQTFGTGITTTAPALNFMRGGRLLVGSSTTLTSVGLEVTTAGSAGALIRLGLYQINADGSLTLLVDAGTVDATTTGLKTLPISQPVTRGSALFLAAVTQGGPTTAPSVRSTTGIDGYIGDPSPSVASTAAVSGMQVASVPGALPAAVSAAGVSATTNTPRVIVGC